MEELSESVLFNINDLINEALTDIYSGASGLVDKSLWKIENRAMESAIATGFGAVQYGQANWELTNQLRNNGSVFSAFKAHKEQNQLVAQLVDPETGKLKTFPQWKKDVAPIIKQYNQDYLRTEYNTAVKRARTAEQFARARQTQDLYPNLRWTPSRSAHPREAHRPFYNQVRTIDDPFWSANYPGSLWNCKCGIERTDEPVTDNVPTVPTVPTVPPAPGLDQNPVEGQLFTKTSPMMQGVPKKEARSIENEANLLLIRDTRMQMRDWAKANIPVPDGLKLKVDVPQFDHLTVHRADIKSITAKPHKYASEAYSLCNQLDKVLNNSEYMGWSPDEFIRLADGTKRQKHVGVEKWLYYRFKLGGKYSYLNVRLINNEYRVYCIVDDAAFDKSIIAVPAKK